MRSVKRFLLGGVVGILCILLIGTPVLALIGNPTSVSIGDLFVFRNVVESGDQLYFVRYSVTYPVTPGEPASNYFLMAIYSTNGTVLLHTRPLNYYQENIISIYLTPAQALVWGDPYIIKIMGNPAIFSPLVENTNMKTRTLGPSDFHEASDLGSYMVAQATILQTNWVVTLLVNGLLNATGATFFNQAVPGLSTMVPLIFQTSISYTSIPPSSENHTYEAAQQAKRGPALTAALNETASGIFGASGNWFGVFAAALLMGVFGGVVFPMTHNPGWVLLGSGFALGLVMWVGLIAMSAFAIIVAFCLILFGIYMLAHI